MKRALVTAAVLTLSTSVASAGGYVGLGIGPGPAVSDNQFMLEEGGRTGRLLGGYSLGRFAVEGSFTQQDLKTSADYVFTGRQAAISGKYTLPLGSGFGVFGRAGVQKTWLIDDTKGLYDADGTGIVIGAGAEYSLDLKLLGGAALFLDYTYNSATVSNPKSSFDFATRQWMLGATVGF